ncbi:MAG: hypothetical protein FVQ80_01110 [Planctomycetes bacterium]|nr:hypothetical protein [Planctomycetota bacterium]
MATKNQLIANRQNAQNSTGPKTPQGKAIVSLNAVKHGLSAQLTLSTLSKVEGSNVEGTTQPVLSSSRDRDVISTESQADFDLYRQNFLDELDPQGPTESMLADRLITLSWRLKRVTKMQNQTIDALNSPGPPSPLEKLTQSLLAKYQPNDQSSVINNQSQDFPLGRMAIKDFANERVLDRLSIYERRIEHSLYKTLLELQRLNMIRNFNQHE